MKGCGATWGGALQLFFFVKTNSKINVDNGVFAYDDVIIIIRF